MTKKQKTENIEVPVVETPVVETIKPKKTSWEIKDRMYKLKGSKKPLSYMLKTSNLFWFDEEKGYERELKYCQNQKTPFVDEIECDKGFLFPFK